ncbi:MAG: hypothetical protein ACXIUZ_06135 [Lysobacteraceae bacterium]
MPFGVIGNSSNIFSSLVNVATIGSALFTGGASLFASQALSQVATRAFAQAAAQFAGQAAGQFATQAFAQAFQGAIQQVFGQPANGASQDLLDQVFDAANHQGPDGRFSGDLDRAQNNMQNAMRELIQHMVDTNRENASGRAREAGGQGGAQGGSNSWLVAIARALGEQAGQIAAQMTKIANEISSLDVSGGSSRQQQSAALRMNQLNAELQGQSQMYKILSDSISTALKSIGDGMSGVARRQ